MENRSFGRTGLTVPAVGMGTWKTFDVRGARAEVGVREVVDAALEGGIRLFDTSPMYGEAERVLAGALGPRRRDALVADKLWTPSARVAEEQIRRAVAWYGTIDVYQIHNLVAWRERLARLEELRAGGVVRVVGATHYDPNAFPELLEVMRTGRLGMVQIPYHAAARAVERTVLPLAEELGLGVLVMEPLGSGALVRRTPGTRDLAPLAEFGVRTWAQALLKWILSDPRVHCVLPATRDVEHARENAAAGEPPWLDADARAWVARLAERA
jgi:aryl-alcohol dehydrogenase-like predicted oxidoreductase